MLFNILLKFFSKFCEGTCPHKLSSSSVPGQDKSLFNSKSTHKSVRQETKRSEYSHYKIEIIKKKYYRE
jgi:hypothetical protein